MPSPLDQGLALYPPRCMCLEPHVVGVELPGVYDGVAYWRCDNCGDRWHRFTEGRVATAVEAHWKMLDDGTCAHPDVWFDRTVCPEPCGSMHDVCIECGRVMDYCPFAQVEARS